MKRTARVGYKILRRSYSTLVSFAPGDGVIKYSEGKWDLREVGNGPLAVFRTLAQARRFVERDDDFLPIYRVAYIRSTTCLGLWAEVVDKSAKDMLGDGVFFRLGAKELPTGTVLADAVYLLERMH